ncbi:MAG: hypothetical protein WBA36_09335 [Mesorhizobium sp.]
MSDFASARLTREEFIDWIAAAADGFPVVPVRETRGSSRTSDILLLWPRYRPDARPIVCVESAEMSDFYAFVSTYYAAVQPFTAYFRVVPLEFAELLEAPPRDARDDARVAKLVAGAALAESWIAASRSRERPSDLFDLLKTMPSFALGQPVLRGYDEAAFNWVVRETGVKRLGQLGLEDDSLNEGTYGAWLNVLAATTETNLIGSSKSTEIASFVGAALEAETVRPDLLRSLSGSLRLDFDLGTMLAAPREERISRFNSAMADLRRGAPDRLNVEFLAGLMLAVVGNGSFELLRSARDFEGWLPGAVTWFGICASLFKESNVLTFGNAAARRVVRDLVRKDDPFDLPAADISSTELRFLLNGKTNLSKLLGNSETISVEILPNVLTRLSLGSGEGAATRNEERQRLLSLMSEMSMLADKGRRLLMPSASSERYDSAPRAPRKSSRLDR